MNARVGAAVVRMLVGHQLRRLREAASVTADQAAEEIRASRPKISRMENGRVGFKARDVADLLTLYGVTGGQMRAQLLELARRANTPGWWTAHSDILPGWFEAYLGLEAAASVIRTFELQFVHGLFQTEDYARAVTMLGHQGAPAWEIDSRVSLRMKRQDLLTAADPPRVWSVMDETALRRPVGGRQVIRAQLHHLLEIAALPQVSLQVVPFGQGGHAAAARSLSCASPNPPCPTWSTSSTSPAPSTCKRPPTWTTTCTSWTASAPKPSPPPPPPASSKRSSPRPSQPQRRRHGGSTGPNPMLSDRPCPLLARLSTADGKGRRSPRQGIR